MKTVWRQREALKSVKRDDQSTRTAALFQEYSSSRAEFVTALAVAPFHATEKRLAAQRLTRRSAAQRRV